jgi:hypothetical protein
LVTFLLVQQIIEKNPIKKLTNPSNPASFPARSCVS